MSKDELKSRVKTIIAESLDVEEEEVKGDASLTEDIGADSLELVDLTMDFEDEFGVKIETSELSDIDTVDDITQLLAKKLKTAA